MAKFFLVCGESSGDRLAALIGKQLIQKGHDVIAWGGPYAQEAGISIDQEINVFKIMGWTDVMTKIPEIYQLLQRCKKSILEANPDTLVLIDFGSFNLRLAKWAHQKGIRVVYYSPPKVWATRPNRITKLKKYCNEIIVLFPFEKEYFSSQDVDVHYFGYPISASIKNFKKDHTFLGRYQLEEGLLCALLPGSRKSEIRKILPIQLAAIKDMGTQYFISCAPNMRQEIETITKNFNIHCPIIPKSDYYNGLAHATSALVASGTATIEAALFKLPQIVTYKTSTFNYRLAKSLIQVPYISLPNLILKKEVVKELIQEHCTIEEIKSNLILLSGKNEKDRIKKEYNHLTNILNVKEGLFKTLVTIIGN